MILGWFHFASLLKKIFIAVYLGVEEKGRSGRAMFIFLKTGLDTIQTVNPKI